MNTVAGSRFKRGPVIFQHPAASTRCAERDGMTQGRRGGVRRRNGPKKTGSHTQTRRSKSYKPSNNVSSPMPSEGVTGREGASPLRHWLRQGCSPQQRRNHSAALTSYARCLARYYSRNYSGGKWRTAKPPSTARRSHGLARCAVSNISQLSWTVFHVFHVFHQVRGMFPVCSLPCSMFH